LQADTGKSAGVFDTAPIHETLEIMIPAQKEKCHQTTVAVDFFTMVRGA